MRHWTNRLSPTITRRQKAISFISWSYAGKRSIFTSYWSSSRRWTVSWCCGYCFTSLAFTWITRRTTNALKSYRRSFRLSCIMVNASGMHQHVSVSWSKASHHLVAMPSIFNIYCSMSELIVKNNCSPYAISLRPYFWRKTLRHRFAWTRIVEPVRTGSW